MFASKPPRVDRFPFGGVLPNGEVARRFSTAEEAQKFEQKTGGAFRWDYRPRSLPPQTNPTNPILVSFRSALQHDVLTTTSWWLTELDPENVDNPDWETWPVIFDATSEERDHARRVLERLEGTGGTPPHGLT